MIAMFYHHLQNLNLHASVPLPFPILASPDTARPERLNDDEITTVPDESPTTQSEPPKLTLLPTPQVTLELHKLALEFGETCHSGDTFDFPAELSPKQIEELVLLARQPLEERNRKIQVEQDLAKIPKKRQHSLTIVREGENQLCAKMWIGPTPKSIEQRRKIAKILQGDESAEERFARRTKKVENRIQTMWSPEHGWMRWNELQHDYVYDPKLNKPMIPENLLNTVLIENLQGHDLLVALHDLLNAHDPVKAIEILETHNVQPFTLRQADHSTWSEKLLLDSVTDSLLNALADLAPDTHTFSETEAQSNSYGYFPLGS